MPALASALLAGILWVLGLTIYALAAHYAWPGGVLPREFRVDVIQAVSPLGRPGNFLLAFLLPVGLVLGWAAFERVAKVDPRREWLRALRWAFSRPLRPALYWAMMMLLVLLILSYLSEAALIGSIAVLGVAALLAPFAILKREVFSFRPNAPWRPRWPGSGPFFVALFLIWLLVLHNEVVLVFVDSEQFLAAILAYALGAPLSLLGIPALCAVLLLRLGPRTAICSLRHAFSWGIISPFLALKARLAYVALLVAPFIVAAWLVMWTVIPTVAQYSVGHGLEVPAYAQQMIKIAAFLGDHGGHFLAFSVYAVELLLAGKIVSSLGGLGDDV